MGQDQRGREQRTRDAKKQTWMLLRAAVIDILLIAGGIASTYTYHWSGTDHSLNLSVLAGCLAAVGVVNFTTFYWFYRELRDAIAAAVVLTYIILVACMPNTNVQKTWISTPRQRAPDPAGGRSPAELPIDSARVFFAAVQTL